MPLPPIEQQQRIVDRIGRLNSRIGEVRRIRAEVGSNASSLLMSMYHKIADKAPRKPLADIAPLNRRPVLVESDKSYRQVSVRSFGKGTFHSGLLVGADVTWEKPFLVRHGDILISNIKAWEGALAVATEADDGLVGSHRYLTCVPIPGVAAARFVCFHLLTPEGLHQVGEASPGSADRNRTLSAKALLRIPIPVPAYDKQIWFDKQCRHIDYLRDVQKRSDAEMDALQASLISAALGQT